MSGKITSAWLKTAELTLLVAALLTPLAFFLNSYDPSQAKAALLQLSVLVAAFAWLGKGIERGRWDLPAQAVPALAPATAFLIWILLRFLAAPGKAHALPGLVETALGPILLALCALELSGGRGARRLISWTLAAAWPAGLYGVLQAFNIDPLSWKGAFGSSAFATFADPDCFGLFLAACFPIALSRVADAERDGWQKSLDLGLCALISLGVLCTGSAEALAAFGLAAVVSMFVLPAFSPTRASVKAALLGLGLVFVVSVGALTVQRPLFGDSLMKSAEARGTTWRGVLSHAAERPIVGHGPGKLALRGPEDERPGSLALKTFAELGLIGLGLWVWALFAPLAAAWRERRTMLQDAPTAAGLAAAAATLALASFFARGSHELVPGWLLWPCAGMAAGLSFLGRKTGPMRVLTVPLSHPDRRKLYAPAFLALAAGLVLPVQWLKGGIIYNQAVAEARADRPEAALEYAARIPAGSPDHLRGLYLRGAGLQTVGRHQDALTAYAEIAAVTPGFGRLSYRQGTAYASLGDHHNAAQAFARQSMKEPLWAKNLVAWSKSALAMKDFTTARQAALRAAAAAPEDPEALVALSNVYAKEGRLALSRRLRGQAVKLRR